jgi:hypothetical protein
MQDLFNPSIRLEEGSLAQMLGTPMGEGSSTPTPGAPLSDGGLAPTSEADPGTSVGPIGQDHEPVWK